MLATITSMKGKSSVFILFILLFLLVSSLPCFEDFIQDGVNGSRAEIDSLDGVGKVANALCALLTCASLEEKSQQAIQTAKKYEIGMVTEKVLEDFNKILSS